MTDLPIVALDTETTSLITPLSRYGRRAWEFGAIKGPGGTYPAVLLAHVEPSPARMRHAVPESLEIGGYHRAPFAINDSEAIRQQKDILAERYGYGGVADYHLVRHGDRAAQYRLALALLRFFDGVTVVGSNPGFDTENVSALLDDAGIPVAQLQPWHYKTYDIAAHGSAVLGLEGTGPSTKDLSEKFGIQRPVEHTALADAHWALDMHGAIERCKRAIV